MSGWLSWSGETEFSKVDVELNGDDPEAMPVIDVVVQPLYGTGIREQSIQLSMDEARQVIAGLAAVIR